jgi:hypothetical protein
MNIPSSSAQTHPSTPYQRPNAELEVLVPINVAGSALIAGYLGLAALLILPAPIALVVGVLALRDLKSQPHKTGHGRAWFAIVAGVIGSIVLLAGFAAGLSSRHH